MCSVFFFFPKLLCQYSDPAQFLVTFQGLLNFIFLKQHPANTKHFRDQTLISLGTIQFTTRETHFIQEEDNISLSLSKV